MGSKILSRDEWVESGDLMRGLAHFGAALFFSIEDFGFLES